MDLYVHVNGDDSAEGNQKAPVKTIHRAQELARMYHSAGNEAVTVNITAGTYYLERPLMFTEEDGGSADRPVCYRGIGEVFISGGRRIYPKWIPYKHGIYQTDVPKGLRFDQLFLNGEKQILARYPNDDPHAKYFNGYAADSFSPKRISHYQNPAGGFMHAMHEALWGDFHYEIQGKNEDHSLQYVGGWQNNRSAQMHPQIRFIENVFEELDSSGEWYHDTKTDTLFYIPKKDNSLDDVYEVVELKNLISVKGSVKAPVCHLRFQGLKFIHAKRTVMEPMERILRSDWCIYRGGAIYLEGCRDVVIDRCEIVDVGGNAIVVSKYNENIKIERCSILRTGASAIVFVGDISAVRSPLFGYEEYHKSPEDVDWTSGPQNQEYPRHCIVENNLIVQSGRVEKQSAGICLSMCQDIVLRHNTIYDVPRAGINICDGTWGGHIIEKNIVFDTVKETGDHGAFNSWGRDRFWDPRYDVMDRQVSENPKLPLLDTLKPVVIQQNIFSCEYGWDIDLDDGSSNYQIIGNLCLHGGIKNREGVCRIVKNNIMYNNTFHPHVWFHKSEDICSHNILFYPYEDINLHSFGELFDYNLLCHNGPAEQAVVLQEKSGMDEHSICAEIEFANPENGDFTVKNSDILVHMGIRQMDFKDCGVTDAALKQQARSPFRNHFLSQPPTVRNEAVIIYEGIRMKVLSGLGELSATGMYEEAGILILEIEKESYWFIVGLRPRDVLLEIDGIAINSIKDVSKMLNEPVTNLTVWREQRKLVLYQNHHGGY